MFVPRRLVVIATQRAAAAPVEGFDLDGRERC